MKTEYKIEIDAEYSGKNHFTYHKNFAPKINKKFHTLMKNACTMMTWNKVSRIVIYMPADFVDENFVEVKPTIIEE